MSVDTIEDNIAPDEGQFLNEVLEMNNAEPDVEKVIAAAVEGAAAPMSTPAVPVAAEASNDDDAPEVDLDAYMQRFDEVSVLNDELQGLANDIVVTEMTQKKVLIMVRYIERLQEQQLKMFALLCDMNNLFGSK